MTNGGDTGLCLTKQGTSPALQPVACPCGVLPTGYLQRWITTINTPGYIQLYTASPSVQSLSVLPDSGQAALVPNIRSVLFTVVNALQPSTMQFVPVFKDVALYQNSTQLGVPFLLNLGFYDSVPPSFSSYGYISIPAGFQVTIINIDTTTTTIIDGGNPSTYSAIASLNITVISTVLYDEADYYGLPLIPNTLGAPITSQSLGSYYLKRSMRLPITQGLIVIDKNSPSSNAYYSTSYSGMFDSYLQMQSTAGALAQCSNTTCIPTLPLPTHYGTGNDTSFVLVGKGCGHCVNGYCGGSNTCACLPGSSGTVCDQCQSGYWGASCASCPSLQNGATCRYDGQSQCSANWAGSTCSVCQWGYYGSSSCNACSCGSGGICSATGSCSCLPYYASTASCDTCDTATYRGTDGQCRPCSPGCTACSSSSVCTNCITGTTLTSGPCVSNTTPTCAGNCTNCFGTDPNQCLSCATGYYIYLNQCVSSCPAGTTATNTGQCQTCPLGCQTCNAQGCTSCVQRYVLDAVSAAGPCVTGGCNSTSYLDTNGACNLCNSLSTTCTACPPNTYLYKGGCFPYTSPPSMTYFSNINATERFSSCDPSCLTCTAASRTSCTACRGSGSLMPDGSCTKRCADGYYASIISGVSTCVSLAGTNPNCLFGTPNLCMRCISSMHLFQGSCVNTCPSGTYLDASTNGCLACSFHCSSCAYGPELCDTCSAGTNLQIDGTCRTITATTTTSTISTISTTSTATTTSITTTDPGTTTTSTAFSMTDTTSTSSTSSTSSTMTSTTTMSTSATSSATLAPYTSTNIYSGSTTSSSVTSISILPTDAPNTLGWGQLSQGAAISALTFSIGIPVLLLLAAIVYCRSKKRRKSISPEKPGPKEMNAVESSNILFTHSLRSLPLLPSAGLTQTQAPAALIADRVAGFTQLQNFFTLVDVKTTSVDISLPKFLRLNFETELIVEGQIGEGGSGDICKGKMTINDRVNVVAVKYVRARTELSREENLLIFQQEVAALSALSYHTNIAHICGYTTDPATIVTHLYTEDLFQHVHSNPSLTNEVVLDIMEGIVNGVSACHAFGIIHKDLKTANIFLEHISDLALWPYRIRIGDFGICRVTGIRRFEEDVSISRKFMNVFGVSIRYAGPEVLQRLSVFREIAHEANAEHLLQDPFAAISVEQDKASDMYSFSMIISEVLCRSVPMNALGMEDVIRRVVLHGDRPQLSADGTELRGAIIRIVTGAWNPDWRKRPTFNDLVGLIGLLKQA